MDGETAISTRAANKAFERGVLVVTAAGNEGNKPWYYISAPADAFGALAVGAVTASNVVVSFSSRGPTYDGRVKPDVVAQGFRVYGAMDGNDDDGYSYSNGTSAACPIVAGAAAQLLQAHPHLDNVRARHVLLHSAEGDGEPIDNERGYGLVNAAAAIGYPNIEIDGWQTLVHKIVPDLDARSESLEIHFAEEDGAWRSRRFDEVAPREYVKRVPRSPFGAAIYFAFTYGVESGPARRAPETGWYVLPPGDVNVFREKDPTRVPAETPTEYLPFAAIDAGVGEAALYRVLSPAAVYRAPAVWNAGENLLAVPDELSNRLDRDEFYLLRAEADEGALGSQIFYLTDLGNWHAVHR